MAFHGARTMNVLLWRIVFFSLGSEAVLGIRNDAETWTYVIRNKENNVALSNERKTGPESEFARLWYRAYRRINTDLDIVKGQGTAAPFWQTIRTLVSNINATSLRLKTIETRMMSRFGDERDVSSNCIESETANLHRQSSYKRKEAKSDSPKHASLLAPGGGYDSSKPSSLSRVGRRNRNHRHKRFAQRRREDTFKHVRIKREMSGQLDTLLGPPVAKGQVMPRPSNQSTDFPFIFTTKYELFTFPGDDHWETTTKIPLNTLDKPSNPFYPLTRESYGAYAVACFSAVIFAVGVIGNIATMCVVCRNYNMRNISNSLLANLALWDVVLLVFCLPLVVYQELTKTWLLGEFSCKAVPYVEVVSLGVVTFTLCALCVDRFHAASNVLAHYEPAESCASTAAKMAVVWLGALLLALPELLIHQLAAEDAGGGAGQRCVARVSPDLPDAAYALGLAYGGARLWWHFGCYFCLPTLFTAAASLATARRVRRAEKACARGGRRERLRLERRMNRLVVALAVLYGLCAIPENARNAVSAYLAVRVPHRAADLLRLASRLLLISRAAATPVLLFCLSRPLSGALLECCCSCCARHSAPRRPGAVGDDAELELAPADPARQRAPADSAAAATGTNC